MDVNEFVHSVTNGANWNGEDPDIDLTVAQQAYADNCGYDAADLDDWVEEFEESYQGNYNSESDFAYEFAHDLGLVDDAVEWPHSCIDWEDAWRELSYSDYWSEIDRVAGEYMIFRAV